MNGHKKPPFGESPLRKAYGAFRLWADLERAALRVFSVPLPPKPELDPPVRREENGKAPR